MKGKVLLVSGSREFNCYPLFKTIMVHIEEQIGRPVEIISGGQPGVDILARIWARQRAIPFTEYPTKRIRMVNLADVVLALPAPNSIGTMEIIRKAERAKKQLFIFNTATLHNQ